MLLLSFTVSFSSCGDDYDDSFLRGEIENIKGELSELRSQLGAVQTLVDALNQGKVVTMVKELDNGKGYLITFNDATSIEVLRGGNASAVSIKEVDGTYYWTVVTNGVAEFLPDENGDRIAVTAEGKVSIDEEGYWLLNGNRMADANGDPIRMVKGEGAFFKDIVVEEEIITFILADDSTIVIDRKTGTFLTFENAIGTPYTLRAGACAEIPFRVSGDMQLVEVVAQPDDWTVTLNLAEKTLSVTPVLNASEEDTFEIRLQGVDKNGLLYLAVASIRVTSCDFTDPNGVFVLNEGNMTTESGSLIYIDGKGNVMDNVYKTINGTELGNTAQDLCITDGKLYIVSQNGRNDGKLVVADSKTLQKIAGYDGELSALSWPTNVAVLDDENIFIRDNAGIYRFDRISGELSLVEGTARANKMTMAMVGGKVFAAQGNNVIVLEKGATAVALTICMEAPVSGVLKAEDGNVWVSMTGNPGHIAKLDGTTGEVIKSNEVTEGSLSAGWGATPGITAIGDVLYYSGASTKIYRHDFATGESKLMIDAKTVVENAGMVYNNIAVHPKTGRVYLTTIKGYGWDFLINNISVFKPEDDSLVLEENYKDHTHFPAGIFFPANF